MPDELEERLERALREQAPASAETRERARRAALAAMPPPGGCARLRGRGVAILIAACAAAFVFGGVTLAANGGRIPLVGGAAHERPKPRPRPRPADLGVVLPRGAVAFSVSADGRAWLASSGGTTLRGAPATAFGLSPGAVWAVVGTEGRMRAVGVQQHGAGFSRVVAGTPIAAAWAPAGIRIAYIVRTAAGDRLFDMYGNGTHNFRVPGRVAAATPAWRWDSLAFAYVSAAGRVRVHDVIDGATASLPRACGLEHVQAVAFAPFGGLLAAADAEGRVEIVDTLHGGRPLCRRGQPGAPSIAWLRPRQVVVGSGRSITRYDLIGRFAGADVTEVPGTLAGLAAGLDGRRLALALRHADGGVRVIEVRTPRFTEASNPLRLYRLLLALHAPVGPVDLAWQ